MRIDEIVSDKIYHYTGIYNAEKIVTGRGFNLTASPGTDVERAMQKGNRFYYLSTTRSKIGDYTLHNSYRTGVVFNLNGRWFNDRYKGAAVDYWESYWIKQRKAGVTDRGREMEDRVFSYEPTIPLPQNMGEVITSIHVLWEEMDERFVIPLRRLLLGAKKNGIPIFLYDEKQAFLLQDTRRTKDISSLIPDLKKIEPDAYQRQSRDSLKPYRELYHKRDRKHLSKDAKKRLSNIVYDSFGDAPRSFSADIHNARTADRENLAKLLAIFRKENITTPKQFLDLLKAKWENIQEDVNEDFNDLGKLSDNELKKGQALVPGEAFREVEGRVFKKIVTRFAKQDALRDLPKGLEDLSTYTTEQYSAMRCYVGPNNSSGYCIADGDLVSVFSIAQSSGKAIVADAVRRGAKTLDCFATRGPDGTISGHLYRLYSWGGFRINTDMNSGTPGEPYAIVNGVSDYVNDQGQVEPDNPSVVVFMTL